MKLGLSYNFQIPGNNVHSHTHIHTPTHAHTYIHRGMYIHLTTANAMNNNNNKHSKIKVIILKEEQGGYMGVDENREAKVIYL